MTSHCRHKAAPASLDALRYLHSATITFQSNAASIPRTAVPSWSSCARRRWQTPFQTFLPLSPQTRSLSTSRRDFSSGSPPKAPPQTHYDLFPNTFPEGPPPRGDFSVNLRELRNEFLRLQAQAHPDLHPAERKKQAEALSSRINEAYKTLQSPLLRAQYLLSLRGETAHEDDAAKLGDASEDQELLMEVLELREAIEEAQVQKDVDAIKEENEERVRGSVKVLEQAFKQDDIDTARKEAVKLRYWINVEETLHAWEQGKPAPLLQH
ncbi:Fe-S protein assembly co-chaperone HscB [Venturia nashicola]|nr:Fe-S protein assembly co-chaperone HscB [Venturia nashicola]